MPNYVPSKDPIRVCPFCHQRRRWPATQLVCLECQARATKKTSLSRHSDPRDQAAINLGECPATDPDAAPDRRLEIEAEQIEACRRVAIYELLRDFHDARSLSIARLLWDLLAQCGIAEPYPQSGTQCPACGRVLSFYDRACRICRHTVPVADDGRQPGGVQVVEFCKRLARSAPANRPFNE